MLQRAYYLLVSKTTGRKWTYILRDEYHARPLEWLTIWSLLVSILANLIPALGELFLLASVSAGALLGHLFWGSSWRRGQK